jgi:hypothetical protein
VPKTAAEFVAEGKAAVENVTPDQVGREVQQGAVLVDLREPEELVSRAVSRARFTCRTGCSSLWPIRPAASIVPTSIPPGV